MSAYSAYSGYGYLFSQMVRRELRQKYKGSMLGVLWCLINPLVLMAAYTMMFGLILKPQSIPDYPLFLMIGLVVRTFFQQSVLLRVAAPGRPLHQIDAAGMVVDRRRKNGRARRRPAERDVLRRGRGLRGRRGGRALPA